MEELLKYASDLIPWIASIAFVLSWFFEFSKIKINPWSWLLKQLAKELNKDVHQRLDEVVNVKSKHYQEIMDIMNDTSEQLHKLNIRIDENEMQRIRWEILDFANSIKNGTKHSKDEFHHIIEMNEKYHRIIEYRGMTNGVIDVEYELILDTYRKCREENSFL